jgi:hypothetical protein
MYITVIHDIRDPEKFWATVEASDLPEGVTIHSVLPNRNGTRSVCLWEAESLETVRSLVETTVGEWSMNDFFEVGEKATGLPA